MATCRVAVVAFQDILPFHLSVPCAVFGERAGRAEALFDIRVCGAEPGPLRSKAGFTIGTEHGLEALAEADIVVVPSWRDPHEPAGEPLLAALRDAHRRGAMIVGLCLGAYVLAQAGLLDGRRATTHWRWTALFARRFPAVCLDPDVLYVDDGEILTSAGTAAGIDCCLHVVRRRYGADTAAGVARGLVVPPHRQGNQALYIEQPIMPSAAEGALARTLEWVAGHLDQPHQLDDLARRTGMSRRTFTRHFRRQMGVTPGQWLLSLRLTRAQRLLETTTEPVERIAERSGFGSALSLRQHFASAFLTTPSAYRREFGGVSSDA